MTSIDDIKRISLIFVKSGMFKTDAKSTADEQMYQAGVKIIAGKEFGIAPFAAMRGINIIKGNAEMSANLMAAKIKRHPKYDYRVKKWDNEGCVITFYELPSPGAPKDQWDELGESSFDMNDARQAGLAGGDNWRKFARNMFFARAISNGVRIYCPDIFYGAPVYTEGELSGALEVESDAQPDTVDVTAKPAHESAQEAELVEPKSESLGDGDGPAMMSAAQQRKMMAQFTALGITDSDARHAYIALAIDREVDSSSDLTMVEARTVIDALDDEVIPEPSRSEPVTTRTSMLPKQSAHIYGLNRKLGRDPKDVEAQVQSIKSKQEADKVIADLEAELAKTQQEGGES